MSRLLSPSICPQRQYSFTAEPGRQMSRQTLALFEFKACLQQARSGKRGGFTKESGCEDKVKYSTARISSTVAGNFWFS